MSGDIYTYIQDIFNIKSNITWNAGLDEAQTGIKIAGRDINNI